MYRIYTKGIVEDESGYGSYGVVTVECRPGYKDIVSSFGYAYSNTTANRMQWHAAISAIERIKEPDAQIVILSDSESLVFGASGQEEPDIAADLLSKFEKVTKNRIIWYCLLDDTIDDDYYYEVEDMAYKILEANR